MNEFREEVYERRKAYNFYTFFFNWKKTCEKQNNLRINQKLNFHLIIWIILSYIKR